MQGSLGLGRLFDRVLGLDVSPAQVEQAKQAVQADNVQFQVRRKRWSSGSTSWCLLAALCVGVGPLAADTRWADCQIIFEVSKEEIVGGVLVLFRCSFKSRKINADVRR